MSLKKIAVTAALLLSTLPSLSQARDTALLLPFDKAVAEAISTGAIMAGVALKGDLAKVQ